MRMLFGKNVMKKIFVYGTLLAVIFAFLVGCGNINGNNTANEESVSKEELEELYLKETYALGMEKEACYKDFSNVDVNMLIVNLEAYKYKNQDAKITVDDVKEFLETEFDPDGKPKVLNPPTVIKDYLFWYWDLKGHTFSLDYYVGLLLFNEDNSDIYGDEEVLEMTEDKLYQLIADYNNCPDIEEYFHR